MKDRDGKLKKESGQGAFGPAWAMVTSDTA